MTRQDALDEAALAVADLIIPAHLLVIGDVEMAAALKANMRAWAGYLARLTSPAAAAAFLREQASDVLVEIRPS